MALIVLFSLHNSEMARTKLSHVAIVATVATVLFAIMLASMLFGTFRVRVTDHFFEEPSDGFVQKAVKIASKFNVKTVVDVSCGECMSWLPKFLAQMPTVTTYTLLEPNPEKANKLKAKFKTFSQVQVVPANIFDYDFPVCDMVFCHNMLQHMPMADAQRAVNKIKTSSANNRIGIAAYECFNGPNVDVKPGEFYGVNLEYPPFNMSPMWREDIANKHAFFVYVYSEEKNKLLNMPKA